MDAFAVSLAATASGKAKGRRAFFRLSFHFGLFQFMLPVVGWYAGALIAPMISAFSSWIAFLILGVIGFRMVKSGLDRSENSGVKDPSKGLTMVALSIGVSIDALAVGLSLAMLNVDIWYPSVIIGLFASLLSLVGLFLGKKLSIHFGKKMEILGGLILLFIGIQILFSSF